MVNPMSILVPAAQQLIDEVTSVDENAAAKPYGDPDGFDRSRSIGFNAKTAKWLAPVLDAIDDDRVKDVDERKDGLVVTFVDDTRADVADSFGVSEVKAVLDGDE
jgi:hypothetical protein